jgi:dUTP pyrophosphatase
VSIELPIKILSKNPKFVLPHYATNDSAGLDLAADIDSNIEIAPGSICLVPTGLSIALPQGYEAQIRPRSGLALKHGVTVLNSPGTIDADYRGEIKVILINHGTEAFQITPGMRIAQMVIAEFVQVKFTKTMELEFSARGEGGFGSTGK